MRENVVSVEKKCVGSSVNFFFICLVTIDMFVIYMVKQYRAIVKRSLIGCIINIFLIQKKGGD